MTNTDKNTQGSRTGFAIGKLGPRALYTAASVALLGFLLVLILLPVLKLMSLSVTGSEGISLDPIIDAFGNARHLAALGRSFFIGISVACIAALVGVPMAWFVSRTNMPGRNFITLIVISTFVMPPYLGAIAWMLLGGPNAGWINRAWMFISGAESGIIDIYTMRGLIFLIALYSFPFSFIFAKSALDLISTELEDAASILGAKRWTILTSITLPMIWPAILGGGVIVLLEAATLFGTPAMIGIPAGITVGTTQIWQFFEYPPRVETAAAYSLAILALTIVLLELQRRFLSKKRFVSVSGKGGARQPTDLGNFRWVALILCLFVGLLAVFLPGLVLAQAAFSKVWSAGFSLGNLTLDNFHYLLFKHTSAVDAIRNTMIYSAVAATLAVLVAISVSYVQQRKLMPFTGLLELLCVAPVAIPSIVLGVAFYATFAPPPFRLYGTAAILILAFMMRFLPIAFMNLSASLRSLNPEMEDAVRILGGGRMTAIRRVVLPLLKSGVAASWLLVFIAATRELSTAIFLTGPRTKVMSVLMLDLSEEGNFEVLAALGCLLLGTAWVIVWIGQRVAGRDFMIRRN